MPVKPKEYDCHFTIRIDKLTGRNQFYEIDDNSEQLLAEDINEYILPFFNRYQVLLDCLNLSKEVRGSYADCREYIGLTPIKNGEIEKGNEIINSFIPNTSEHWAGKIDF